MLWEFFRRYGERLVVLVSGLSSVILTTIAMSHETSWRVLGFWLSGYVCCVITAFLMWREVNIKFDDATTRLKARGLTAAQIQTARNQLAVLNEGERRLVRQLLLDDHLRLDQIERWHPGVDIIRIHRETSFLQCDNEAKLSSVTAMGTLPADITWTVHLAWRAILNELLVNPPKKWAIWSSIWRHFLALIRELRCPIWRIRRCKEAKPQLQSHTTEQPELQPPQ